MKVKTKLQEGDAFCFSGTIESGEAAREWLSSLDIENAELTTQGESAPFALDLITDSGIATLEAGDWLICLGGKLRVEFGAEFEERYEKL